MQFFLVQHGEATSEAEDPARPLTERGRDEVLQVAQAAARLGIQPAKLLHSGKLRARQTAEIFASELKPARGLAEQSGLSPNDDPREAARLLHGSEESTMIVGHLPHLSRLASLLLTGGSTHEIIAFRMGAIVCISREAEAWRLCWILTPEMAAANV